MILYVKEIGLYPPNNYYINIEEQNKVHKLMHSYGLDKYFSPLVAHYRWSKFSNYLGLEWLEPSKDAVELIFNVTLSEYN
jgi:hypothetical protein